MRNLIIMLCLAFLLCISFISRAGLRYKVEKMEQEIIATQLVQQQQLDVLFKDVHSMSNVVVLLKSQAEILQAIERRTR